MNHKTQKGAALILTMILIAVLSVMTVSMLFLSQSEAWSTHNFKLMSQARDAAEAGVNQAARFIVNDYTPPDVATADADYDRTVWPVENASDEPVVLSADSDVTGTYPDSTVQDAYAAAAQGSITAGTQPMTYETSATLLGMRKVELYAVGDKVIQRWEIASRGTIDGIEDAEVEVSAILDRTTQDTFGYAAFGVSQGCPPDPTGLEFGGNTMTDSYDSRDYDTACSGPPSADPNCGALTDTGGNLGTNGSMEVIGGSVDINGSLSTPRTGVGTCPPVDNPDVVEEGVIQLPQEIEFEDPPFPSPVDNPISNDTLPNNASTCPGIDGCLPRVPPAKNKFTLTPGVYGNLSGGGGAAKEIHLTTGTYNINSLDLGANVTVIIDAPGGVTLNIAGCLTYNVGATACATYMVAPLSTGGGSFTNSSYDASDLEILYAGPGQLQLRGTSGLAATVYAPSADVATVGTTDFYGAVIGNTIDWTGTAQIHYDRALAGDAQSYGPWMLQGFTWKKF